MHVVETDNSLLNPCAMVVLTYHKLSVLCTNCDYEFICLFPISYVSCGTENSPMVWC